MSVTGHGYVEVIHADSEFVACPARINFDSIPDVYALLAFPWGDHDPQEDDLPPPVVKPRGFPPNLGLLTLHEVSLYVEDDPKKRRQNRERCITSREAKKLLPLPYRLAGFFQDPDVRCASWLTTEEVTLAGQRYRERNKHSSPDLEAVAGMMALYEAAWRLNGRARPTVRLIVWFT